MPKKTPQAFVDSGYEREENDRYWTRPDYTATLIPHLADVGLYPRYENPVWECAAGRGDMSKVLSKAGFRVRASDIDPKAFGILKADFLALDFKDKEVRKKYGESVAIITNPPYGREAEKFVRRALSIPGIQVAAFLLRSNWKCPSQAGSKRPSLFTEKSANGMRFAMEIILPERPMWDWWSKKEDGEKSNTPFHPYSWFVWSSHWKQPPTIRWGK